MERDPFCVVFDIETDTGVPFGLASDARELWLQHRMQFTVACALAIPSSALEARVAASEALREAKKLTYWRDVAGDGCSPVEHLLQLFDDAEVIVGYNCLQFDFPVLRRFYNMNRQPDKSPLQRYLAHRAKTLDIMLRVRDVTGTYFKLDNILQSCGLSTKSGSGADAIVMWERGERDLLERYCATDVEVTARLAMEKHITLPTGDVLPHRVHGLRCALAAARESSASDKRKRRRAGAAPAEQQQQQS